MWHNKVVRCSKAAKTPRPRLHWWPPEEQEMFIPDEKMGALP
jgi:hypothetical protein